MMHDGTSTGTDARCATDATAGRGGGSPQIPTRLQPQQADLLDALRCMTWCEAPDLMEASGIPTFKSLRVQICNLRIAGYQIDVRRRSPRGERETAYSLRGEP